MTGPPYQTSPAHLWRFRVGYGRHGRNRDPTLTESGTASEVARAARIAILAASPVRR